MLRTLFLICFALGFPAFVYISASLNYWLDYFGTFVREDLNGQAFDFIVIGSGSAGAVVAHRLSKHNNVLLLETGGYPTPVNHIPGFTMNLFGYPQFDYEYKTVPQKNSCLGLVNNQSIWNRGKVLGGSTVLNYMFYLRGSPYDYDNWARITGDDDWNYENVLPFFKKSIREYKGKFQDDKKNYANSEYGFLSVESRIWTPLAKEFMDGGRELGMDEMDANGPQRSGFSYIEVTQKDGVRMSTYKAILEKLTNSNNAKISPHSQAVKIKLDKKNRAEGVWYNHHGKLKFARVRKEVIVSAGAIDSPKLLMLSGIGPREHLESIGINPKVNLPVGQNLQDHVGALVFPFVIDKPSSFILERDFGPELFLEYFSTGEGPLTVPSACTTQAFLTSSFVNTTKHDWPDIQFVLIPTGFSSGLRKMLVEAQGYRDDVLRAMMDPFEGRDGFIYFIIAGRPESHGAITLKDKNPMSPPLIDPNYFGNTKDLKVVIEGIKFLMKLSENTNTFKSLGTRFTNIPVPGCEHVKYRSDEYWECFVRQGTKTMWHFSGTCRAGKISDPRSVVDSKLRVLNTKGLRVIDASIMPELVNANTNAPTIMIGEKGSHFIQDYWSLQYSVCDKYDRFLYLDDRKCYYLQFP